MLSVIFAIAACGLGRGAAQSLGSSEVVHPHVVLKKHPHLKQRETVVSLRPPRGSFYDYEGDDSYAFFQSVEDALPDKFDWRNVSGVSYVTRTMNQHIPKYCGSCWAHAATSVFNDRLKILRQAQWPDIELSVQYALNCLTEAGTCNGGSDLLLFEQFELHTVPDETCEVYLAEDQACVPENQCRNCFGPPGKGFCFPQPSYTAYRAKDFGFFEDSRHKEERDLEEAGRESAGGGAAEEMFGPRSDHEAFVNHMKREIYHGGPISCGVDADVMFDYTKGQIVSQIGKEINHVVEVAGWDETGDIPYWIMRNSWGTYWGDQGWAHVQMGTNAALLESFCAWVVPDWPPQIIVVANATTPPPQSLSDYQEFLGIGEEEFVGENLPQKTKALKSSTPVGELFIVQ